MRDTRNQIVFFEPYDTQAAEQKLEAMARKGWVLDKIGVYSWRYKRTELQEVKVSILYLPTDLWEPTDERSQMLEELCAHDGWVLRAASGQMQVYYNDDPQARPLETDALPQAEAIHKAMDKGAVKTARWNIVMDLVLLAVQAWTFHTDPIFFLSSTMACVPLALLLSLLSSVVQLVNCRRWWRQALPAAQEGVFVPYRGNRFLRALLWIGDGGVLLLLASSFGGRWAFLLLCFVPVLVLVPLINALSDSLRTSGVSRKVNRGVSIGATVVLTMVLLVGVVWVALTFHLSGNHKPVERYEEYGHVMDIYQDDLPLRMEDYREISQDVRWSYEAAPNNSFLLRTTHYTQWPATTQGDHPMLDYQTVEVKFAPLYGLVKDTLLTYRTERPYWEGAEMRVVDPAPWRCREAFQLWDNGTQCATYLLCWEDTITEVTLPELPTVEQIGIIAQKLHP